MKDLVFNFYSEPQNRFPLVDADGDPLELTLDAAAGMLRIVGDRIAAFPLVIDGEPQNLAAFVTSIAGGPQVLELGTVDFGGQAEYLEDYPLTDENDMTNVRLGIVAGGIGILDLRNIGRSSHTKFDLHVVPLQLSITGIFLRASTLRHDPSASATPWYRQENFPS